MRALSAVRRAAVRRAAALAFGAAASLSAACVEETRYLAPGSFALAVEGPLADLRVGDPADPIISVERGPGSTGEIALSLEDLPLGVSFEAGAIPAGLSRGVIRFHAEGGLPGYRLPLTIVGRGDGGVAEVRISPYLRGARGSVDRYFAPLDVAPTFDALPVSHDGELLLGTSSSFYRIDEQGLDDRSFGDGVGVSDLFYSEVFGETHFCPESRPTAVGYLSDGKLIVALPYASIEAPDATAGLVLFRLDRRGLLDPSYGPSGAASSVKLPLPGYTPYSLEVLADDSLRVYVEAAAGPPRWLIISSRGELVEDRPTGALGRLGAERRELLVQPDGKVVAAGPARLVRYGTDFQVDPTFGQGGVIATGTQPPFLGQFSGGYLAAGATDEGAALWLFDEAWRPLPAFAAGRLAPQLPGRAVSAYEVEGGVHVAVATPTRVLLLRYLLDGSLDRRFGVDGIVDLGPREPSHLPLHFPTSHGRKYTVVRSGTRYEVTRTWD